MVTIMQGSGPGHPLCFSLAEDTKANDLFILPNGNAIASFALLALRDFGLDPAACTSGLTPEQVEVAELEAELEQAVADKVIFGAHWSTASDGTHAYHINDPKSTRPQLDWCSGWKGTRLEAAKAAAAFVRDQPPPKPKLPALQSMTPTEVQAELEQRGCRRVWGEGFFAPEIQRQDGSYVACLAQHDESFDGFLRRALAEVRKQDGIL